MKRVYKVSTTWSAHLAYAIGLIATDGNLSKNERTINFTSKDESLVMIYKKCLNLSNKIGRKARGGGFEKKYFVLQFGDRNFYEFLLSIGLMQAKSKKLNSIKIPKNYFADFLRGCIDGDGNISITDHPESIHPQLRVRLYSASPNFLKWIQEKIKEYIMVAGAKIKNGARVFILSYAKEDSIRLLQYLYYSKEIPYLERKYLLAKMFLPIV